jgi:L-talarate/galactarate dehydratase
MTTTMSAVVPPAPVETTADRIRHVKLSTLTLPLDTPISDAKVLTGRQKPMT